VDKFGYLPYCREAELLKQVRSQTEFGNELWHSRQYLSSYYKFSHLKSTKTLCLCASVPLCLCHFVPEQLLNILP